MPVRTEVQPFLGYRQSAGQATDAADALDEAKAFLIGHLSGGFTEPWTPVVLVPVVSAPASMREVAGFTDSSDVDTLLRVRWAAVDEAADDW